MPEGLKALMVVLPIALAVFVVAKPICLHFMTVEDFARRRNVWLALTVTAFLSPSFWLFVLVAVPLLAWSAHKDTNVVALYVLMMHVISNNIAIPIPVVGIQALFDLNMYRVLTFAILVPAAWRLLGSADKPRSRALAWMDALVLAYGCLQVVLLFPHDSLTNVIRHGFLYAVDVLALFYVVSRTCTNQRAIVEAMASFCLACAIFAPLALFESMKVWLLYGEVASQWGAPIAWGWVFRDGNLRVQVSAGHSITLGYLMALAFGFWLYLSSHIRSKPLTIAVAVWMWVGLLAAYSRSPWIVAAVTLFAFLALGPQGPARLIKASVLSAIATGLILISPIGTRVIDNLPFVGTVDNITIVYRQRLAERSWEMIQQNPLFGDLFVLSRLEDLRQGQGIIDLMNTYAATAMFYGIVGLSIFIGIFIVGTWSAYRLARRSVLTNPDLSLLGANLTACMLGVLVMMATGGFGGAFAQAGWILAGIVAGYSYLGREQAPARTGRVLQTGPTVRSVRP